MFEVEERHATRLGDLSNYVVLSTSHSERADVLVACAYKRMFGFGNAIHQGIGFCQEKTCCSVPRIN